MNLPMDLIVERLAYLYPVNHIQDMSHWVRGIKLLPENAENLNTEYFYITDNVDAISEKLQVDVLILDKKRECVHFPQSYLISYTKEPLSEIMNELLGLQSLLQKWDLELSLSVSRNMGVQDLLNLSEPVLGNPIMILDPSYRLIAGTTSFDTDDPVFKEILDTGYLSQKEFLKLEKNNYFTPDHYSGETLILPPSEIKDYTSTLTAVLDDDHHVQYEVFMLFSNVPFSEGLYQLYLYLLDHIMHYLKEKDALKTATERYEYVITDLLEGKEIAPEELADRVNCFMENYPKRYNLILLQMDHNTDMYRKYALFSLKSIFPDTKFIHYKNNLIFFAELGNQGQYLTSFANQFLIKLQNYLVLSKAAVGISVTYTDLKNIPQAFIQAECALSMGKELNLPLTSGGYDRIYWYANYYIYSLIHYAHLQMPQLDLLTRAYHVIYEYDRKNHTDLLHIILTYLHHERNFTDTAAELHMHRNNVIYHIKKAEEVLQLDLSDQEMRLQLLIGEKICQMHPEVLEEEFL